MNQKGFTIIELIIVMGVAIILLGLTLGSSITFRTSTLTDTTITTFITDLRNQQIKAMAGDTEGRGIPDSYGIHISLTKYTLFHGNTYSPTDPSNFDVPIDPKINLTTLFPNSIIVFNVKSGEITNFTTGSDTITIKETVNNNQKVIQLNKLGSVISVN